MDDLVYRLTMRAADDDCTAAVERIASLTEAVRVLTEALEMAIIDLRVTAMKLVDDEDYINEMLEPHRAALTTAKELTK